MEIDNFFNTHSEKEELPKMTVSEFVTKTRLILSNIGKAYSTANQWRKVEDQECENQDCDNCKGEGLIPINGLGSHCAADPSEGNCFVLEFAYELFIKEIENIMFHDDKYSFYELLNCEIITDEMLKQEEE